MKTDQGPFHITVGPLIKLLGKHVTSIPHVLISIRLHFPGLFWVKKLVWGRKTPKLPLTAHCGLNLFSRPGTFLRKMQHVSNPPFPSLSQYRWGNHLHCNKEQNIAVVLLPNSRQSVFNYSISMWWVIQPYSFKLQQYIQQLAPLQLKYNPMPEA